MEIFLTGKERPWEEGWLVMREEITEVDFLCFLIWGIYMQPLHFFNYEVRYTYINMDYKWEYLFAWTYLQENNYQAEPQLS